MKESTAGAVFIRMQNIRFRIHSCVLSLLIKMKSTFTFVPLLFFPPSNQDSATMQFCANKLDKKDFFGKSDPFMVFYRSNEDGT